MTWTMRVGLVKSENVLSALVGLFGSHPVGARRKAELCSLFWPACQHGLANLVCKYSRHAVGCDTVAKLTCNVRGLRAPGHVLFALGLAADAHQIGKAIGKSVKCGTVRPAAAQATRSITNWSAVWAGAELFGSGGALVGLAAGPGAVVTSGVGALVGGYLGLFASEWIARRIEVSN